MTMEDAINLMTKMSPLKLNDREAIYCFGMSKMTVVNEAEESSTKYKRLVFVEFLEMIGRIADIKFRGSEMDSLPLPKKLEFILDDLLTLVGEKRKETKNE